MEYSIFLWKSVLSKIPKFMRRESSLEMEKSVLSSLSNYFIREYSLQERKLILELILAFSCLLLILNYPLKRVHSEYGIITKGVYTLWYNFLTAECTLSPPKDVRDFTWFLHSFYAKIKNGSGATFDFRILEYTY